MEALYLVLMSGVAVAILVSMFEAVKAVKKADVAATGSPVVEKQRKVA